MNSNLFNFSAPVKRSFILFPVFFLLIASAYPQTKDTKQNASSQNHDTYKVKRGETLYSIAKKFHTTTDHLKKLNPGLNTKELDAGSRINVPVLSAEVKKKDKEQAKKLRHAVTYKVQPKETLSAIAKKFNTDSKTLMAWNNLSKAEVTSGQELIVGFTSPKYAAKYTPSSSSSQKNMEKAGVGSTAKSNEMAAPEAVNVQSGAGTWIKDVDDAGNYYALHATAPIGTLIEVTNVMNDKKVTVKVIGKLPATGENENTIIKLSASASKALNILDQKYRVELRYPVKK